MSKDSDLSTKVLGALGLKDTHPIYVAVPAGIVAGLVSLSVYRYYMGSSRQPEHKRKELETKLSQVL
jgi:hypothetical protein